MKSRERKFRLSYVVKRAVDTSCATSQKRPEIPFNVLSADIARANNRGSALGMIQYHHSIFDISGVNRCRASI